MHGPEVCRSSDSFRTVEFVPCSRINHLLQKTPSYRALLPDSSRLAEINSAITGAVCSIEPDAHNMKVIVGGRVQCIVQVADVRARCQVQDLISTKTLIQERLAPGLGAQQVLSNVTFSFPNSLENELPVIDGS